MISQKELNQLKKEMPYGYHKMLISNTGLSAKTVTNFLSGTRYNINIHKAAIALAAQYKQEIEDLSRKQRKVLQ